MSLDISLTVIKETEVFDANITHNLNKMASEAGIYKELWRPDEIGILFAKQLIKPLEVGLQRLLDDPEKYVKFNPKNGWGNYAGLVTFVKKYICYCIKYPNAKIHISR